MSALSVFGVGVNFFTWAGSSYMCIILGWMMSLCMTIEFLFFLAILIFLSEDLMGNKYGLGWIEVMESEVSEEKIFSEDLKGWMMTYNVYYTSWFIFIQLAFSIFWFYFGFGLIFGFSYEKGVLSSNGHLLGELVFSVEVWYFLGVEKEEMLWFIFIMVSKVEGVIYMGESFSILFMLILCLYFFTMLFGMWGSSVLKFMMSV